jgi:hypothetical protein
MSLQQVLIRVLHKFMFDSCELFGNLIIIVTTNLTLDLLKYYFYLSSTKFLLIHMH